MGSVVRRMLDELDVLIKDRSLHSGDARSPVSVASLVEDAELFYWWLPSPVLGLALHVGGEASITFNCELNEPEHSADKRYATAHEAGHILLDHQGWFTVWRARTQDEVDKGHGLECLTRNRQERECDLAAAYLLIRRSTLEELRDEEPAYIAAVLDVPEYLVWLRLEIYQRYGR